MAILNLAGLTIDLKQKPMKHLRLRICGPLADIKVSAPLKMNKSYIENFIISKIDWIKKQQKRILSQKFIAPKKFLDGEIHDFLGNKLQLRIVENSRISKVSLSQDAITIFYKERTPNFEKRKKALDEFYRKELKKIIPNYIKILEEKMQVKVNEFGIKKMKTRWGTCNSRAKRIWINLELAKKPLTCLEYIVVHEMAHLLEKNHSKRFYALMDQFMPNWKECRELLRNPKN